MQTVADKMPVISKDAYNLHKPSIYHDVRVVLTLSQILSILLCIFCIEIKIFNVISGVIFVFLFVIILIFIFHNYL